MSAPAKLAPEIEERARQLAHDIKGRRNGLASEELLLIGRGPHTKLCRPAKYRDLDQARINGMVIALTYLLGRPSDMQLAEAFIEDTPAWRALL